MAKRNVIVCDSSGCLRVSCIEPALFMRLSGEIASRRSIVQRPRSRLAALADLIPHLSFDDVALLVPKISERLVGVLEQLHERAAHGDVSPSNIVLTHYAGISLLHPSNGRSTVTGFNCSPPWLDASASDYLALGAVLFAVASDGACPFAGATLAELHGAVRAGAPPLPASVPRPIADMILRLLRAPQEAAAAAAARRSSAPAGVTLSAQPSAKVPPSHETHSSAAVSSAAPASAGPEAISLSELLEAMGNGEEEDGDFRDIGGVATTGVPAPSTEPVAPPQPTLSRANSSSSSSSGRVKRSPPSVPSSAARPRRVSSALESVSPQQRAAAAAVAAVGAGASTPSPPGAGGSSHSPRSRSIEPTARSGGSASGAGASLPADAMMPLGGALRGSSAGGGGGCVAAGGAAARSLNMSPLLARKLAAAEAAEAAVEAQVQ